VALGLADDGWDLAVSYWHPYDDRIGLERSGGDVEAIVAEIRAKGRRVVALPADLERVDGADSLVRSVTERLGPLTGLLLSHCESVDSGLLDTSVESFDRHYAVNVRASWQLIAALGQPRPGRHRLDG
jgi:3-oxoacyl-[acyl-carrier protein] reductase